MYGTKRILIARVHYAQQNRTQARYPSEEFSPDETKGQNSGTGFRSEICEKITMMMMDGMQSGNAETSH